MDIFGLEEEKQEKTKGSQLLAAFVVVIGAAVLGLGAYGLVYGSSAPKDFLGKAAALAFKAFHDVLGSGSGEKLAAEINLGGGLQSPAVFKTTPSGAVQGYAGAEAAPAPRVSNNKEGVDSGASVESSPTSSPKTNSGNVSASTGTAAQTSSAKSAKTVSAPVAPVCSFTVESNPTRKIVFNEIAWMGSVPRSGETATQAANNEWIELKNISQDDIDLAGWQILNDTGKFKVVFAVGERLSAGGFYLLERTDDDSVPGIGANKIYSGALSNSGVNLRLFGVDCGLVDEIVNASSGWSAGDNVTKATMERNAGDFGWHTSVSPSGTPKAENSVPVVAAAPQAAISSSTATTATSVPSVAASSSINSSAATSSGLYYSVGVSLQGGSGTIVSTPAGILCGTDCTESYKEGTQIILTATPDNNSSFLGWSGPCSGTGICVFTVENTMAVVSMFRSLAAVPVSSPGGNQGAQNESSTTPAPILGGVVISEIMAGADGNTDYEFVEIYNPTPNQIDLTGWTIKKKSSTGTESSLLVASRMSGKSIGANRYFLAANEGGYTDSVTPDVTWAHSNTIAYTNNAVILYDASGTKIEEVDWTEIPAGKSYARVSWDSGNFIVQDVPTPQNSSAN